jgi:hypothetical protein
MRFLRRWSIIVGAALACSASPARAAFEMPRQVPVAKIVQQVGLTEISVDYDCPAVGGRKIWGGVVPFDRVWTVGGSQVAKVRFTKEVSLGDKAVPAGTYWVFAIPGRASWTIMLNKSTEPVASQRDYKPDLDVVRVKVQPKAVARRERLTFLFSDLSDDRAALDLEWDDVRVSIPVRANTTEQVLSAIGDLDNAWRSFANAARYMLEVKKDYDAGLTYIDQSLALREDWYSLWIKATLLAGKGRFAEANQVAERAYALERKVGNGTALEPELQAAIAEWRRKGHVADTQAKRVERDEKRDEKEQRPEVKTAADERTSPPAAFTPAAATSESTVLRRARLRRR